MSRNKDINNYITEKEIKSQESDRYNQELKEIKN